MRKNIVNVQNHLFSRTPSATLIRGNVKFEIDEYHRMIAWLAENVGPALQEYNERDGTQIGRSGEEWVLYLHPYGSPMGIGFEDDYLWTVWINDDELALLFKLTWP